MSNTNNSGPLDGQGPPGGIEQGANPRPAVPQPPEPQPPRDPRGDVVPDYTAPEHAEAMAGAASQYSVPEDVARTILAERWYAEHQGHLQAWQEHQDRLAARRAQVEEPRLPVEGEPHPGLVNAAVEPTLSHAQNTFSGVSAKCKLPAFSAGTPLGDSESAPMALYAIQQLSDFKYVPFWYATDDGREDARRRNSEAPDSATDTSMHARLDPLTKTYTFAPAASMYKPSPNAIPDERLTLRQLTEGKWIFVETLESLGWDREHIDAHALLIVALEKHNAPRRFPRTGQRALMRYFAEVRRDYHASIASGRQNIPDISKINQDRIREILDDLHDEDLEARTKPVCPVLL